MRRADVALISQDSETWGEGAVTNRSGEFVFTNVRAGKYFVVVSAPDIVSPWNQIDRRDSLALKIALGQIEDGFSEVLVDGRGSVTTEIRASRGGAITGRVLSESDEPVAKARITLFKIDDGKLRPTVTRYLLDSHKRMFETDSRGIYRIFGLSAGEYKVRASESDEGGSPDDAPEGSYTNGSMVVAYYPKALRVQDAAIVKVQQGAETKNVDIRFPDRSVHRVSGTVAVGGRAVSNAQIRLTGGEPQVDRYRIDSAQASSDRDGKWEVRAVPDGAYTLSVSGLVIGMVFIDGKRPTSVVPQTREVIVAGSDVTDLRVELVEAGNLFGTVSVEGKSPLPDLLRVQMVPSNPSSRTPGPKPETGSVDLSSDADPYNNGTGQAFVNEGKFTVSELHSGWFEFRVYGLGSSHYVKSITLNGKDFLRNPIRIEEGKTLNGLHIVLSSDLVTLSGKAVEKTDRSKPLTEAGILLFPVEAERRRITGSPLIARSDKEGRFAVKGAPGEYFVFVLERPRKGIPLVVPTEERLIKDSAVLQKVRLQPGDEKRIVEVVGPN